MNPLDDPAISPGEVADYYDSIKTQPQSSIAL